MESEIEYSIGEAPEKNKLDAMAKNALEERESIEQNRPELSQLILREGSSFSNTQTGNIVFKDDKNTVVQISKNIGLRYDSSMFQENKLNDRVAVMMVNDEHRVMSAEVFETQQHASQDRAVELDNEM